MMLAFTHLFTASNGATEIAGTGLRVYTVLGLYETGDSPEYIAEEYDVPLAAVFECLAYASDHPDEMEAIRRGDEAAERQIIAGLPEHLREQVEASVLEDEKVRREFIRRAKQARLGTLVS
jgi:uncharacterized protein (DUF433 family)